MYFSFETESAVDGECNRRAFDLLRILELQCEEVAGIRRAFGKFCASQDNGSLLKRVSKPGREVVTFPLQALKKSHLSGIAEN